jgi:RNA polymerase sigma-70 factor (ECF subfamily)
MSTQPHEVLLESACRGDRAALDQLVQLYYARVYRYGRRVCLNPSDADDAVQEAFVALGRTVTTFRHEASLSTWLFTVVKNMCMRMLRPFARQRRHLGEAVDVQALDELRDESLTPEEQLERQRMVDAVEHSLLRLEPLYREVLVLRDVEGLSGPDVARRLGISVAAMKTRLHRARHLLRELLLRQEAPGLGS